MVLSWCSTGPKEESGRSVGHDIQPDRNAKRLSAERTTSSLMLVGSIIRYLSPWSLIILEMLTVAQLGKNSPPPFYENQMFIAVFKGIHHCSLSRVTSIPSTSSNCTFLRFYIKMLIVFWGFTLPSVICRFQQFRTNKLRSKKAQYTL